MKTLKYLLFVMCLAFSFTDAFATSGGTGGSGNSSGTKTVKVKPHPVINPLVVPNPRRTNSVAAVVNQTGEREFEVTFTEPYTDVDIIIYNEEDEVIGEFTAEDVIEGETIVITTTEDGAVMIYIYSNDEEVFNAEL